MDVSEYNDQGGISMGKTNQEKEWIERWNQEHLLRESWQHHAMALEKLVRGLGFEPPGRPAPLTD